MKTILIVDNDPDFLNTRVEFLEIAGYDIVKASSQADAEQLLRERWFPLLILDIRMVDDDDEKDLSGLILAKSEFCRASSRIFLSGYLNPEIVRELLQLQRDGKRLAIDVVHKEEGPDALINAVERAFLQHIPINWDLDILWEARERFSLTNLMEPALRDQTLVQRAEELADLFRRLFAQKDQIRITRLLWQRKHRIALTVFAFKKDTPLESFLVVCGPSQAIKTEAKRFRELAPKATSPNGATLHHTAETTHYAANAYALSNANLANLHTLEDIYRTDNRVFRTALKTLCLHTLTDWHRGDSTMDEENSLDDLYRNGLELTGDVISRERIETLVNMIIQQAPTLGLRFTLSPDKLLLHFSGGHLSLANPLTRLYQDAPIGNPVVTAAVPGTLTGDNILTESGEFVWLTDFASAQMAPLLWNYIALESLIRYDWQETDNLIRLYELEQALTNTPFASGIARDLEPEVRSPARAIDELRQLASEMVENYDQPYHLGLFYQAMQRIAALNPNHPLMKKELTRLAHLLISAAMLAEKLQHETPPPPADPCLTIDHRNHHVQVRGKRVTINGLGYELLHYLYQHANQLCRREEIYREVLGVENFDRLSYAEKKNEENRLNAAIRRLRERIEDDPNDPHFLLTESGVGYRLRDCPER